MAGELETAVRKMFDALDRGDAGSVGEDIASDAQGIDEISRRWMRGADEVRAYTSQLSSQAKDVRSELVHVHETVWGDVGLLTCWLEQDYTFEGDRRHISAPTTVVLRREGGAWKFALFHSAPLPEQS